MEINVTRTSLPPFEEFCSQIRSLWDSHMVTNMGEKHQELERRLEAFLEGPVTLYANGHLALEAALRAWNLPRGSEVITTPFTFVSTVHAIVRCGLVPVFCDVREQDGTLDPDCLESLIGRETSAILPVHVYGNVCQVERIGEIAQRHGLPVIYDAAHTFGVRYKGIPAVRYGDMSILSFHATKVFSTVEGGAVCYADGRFRQRLEDERNFGIRDLEECEAAGGNAKLNEFQAAMGLCNLSHFADELLRRARVYAWYKESLPSGVTLLSPRKGTEPNYAYLPVLFGSRRERDTAYGALKRAGIHARKYFYPLVSAYPPYQSTKGRPTPVADSLSARVLCLPLYPDLSREEVDLICGLLEDYQE